MLGFLNNNSFGCMISPFPRLDWCWEEAYFSVPHDYTDSLAALTQDNRLSLATL